jgi:hypothetical protein
LSGTIIEKGDAQPPFSCLYLSKFRTYPTIISKEKRKGKNKKESNFSGG